MRRHTSRPLSLAVALLAATTAFSIPLPTAVAAANPGQMESMDLTVTPAAQGIGGPFEAVLTLSFATDPHATLIVYNFTAELALDPDLALAPISLDNPLHVGQIDLPPTQSFLVLTYRWNLTAVAIGDHNPKNVSVTVTTDSSGGGTDTASVTVREGIVIGQVTATPAHPTISDAMTFKVAVSSGFDESTSPLEVRIFLYTTTAPVKPVSANGTTVTLSNGSTVAGAGLPMPSDGNGTYSYVVPAQPRGTLIYWVLASTPHSNATTAPGRLLVEDPAVTNAVSTVALTAVLGLGAASTVYVIWDPASRKKASGFVHNSPDRVRLAFLVLALGCAIFAAATVMGALHEFWVRLGYA